MLRNTRLRAAAARRALSTSGAGRRRFDPSAILPSAAGEVRVCSNTTRDAQQSNLAASMSDAHRQEIAALIDACRPTEGAPGYEQTWGGTVPLFDLWKRGVGSFEELRRMTAMMPNTPSSALIRGTSGCSMSPLPSDALRAFISRAYGAGVDVFTTFDAHNDPAIIAPVAEAIHEAGGHFQGALSYSVWPEDPTVYNVRWCVDYFREMVALGAHSLYVKDPSGVLTPAMAGAIAAEVKDAFPDVPLGFHVHYQSGFGYMTYLEAVRNGANAIECSAGLSDGAGQPYTLTMLRALEDMGFSTGRPDQAAIQRVHDLVKPIRETYPAGRRVITPDVRVELTGIAGGQRTILNAELEEAGQAALIPQVDRLVREVRQEGGLVCQVTPAADSYARETLRRLRGLPDYAPGFAAIVTGENGLTKEPISAEHTRAALVARAVAAARASAAALGPEAAAALARDAEGSAARVAVDQTLALSAPVVARRRLAEVRARVRQLTELLEAGGEPAALLERLVAAAAQEGVRSVADRVDVLRREEAALVAGGAGEADPEGEALYEALQRGDAESDALRARLVAENGPLAAALSRCPVEAADAFTRRLYSEASFKTVLKHTVLPPAMDEARDYVRELDERELLGLTDTDTEAEDNAVLQACFGSAPPTGMLLAFFRNHKVVGPAAWEPAHDRDAELKRLEAAGLPVHDALRPAGGAGAPPLPRAPAMRGVHKAVARMAGTKTVERLAAALEREAFLRSRLAACDAGRLGQSTRDRAEALLTENAAERDALVAEAERELAAAVAARPGTVAEARPVLRGSTVAFETDADGELELARGLLGEAVLLTAHHARQ